MRTAQEVRDLINHFGSNPLQLLAALDGFYECPCDLSGKRLGALVGYAGRYSCADQDLQYVGEVYANFAQAEQWPEVMDYYADMLISQFSVVLEGCTFCGMPMGGLAFAQALARRALGRFIFAEKKVVALATATSRERSKLFLGRHQVRAGEQVVLCEDVVNNFSTTNKGVLLVESMGAEVVAIAAMLNRSLDVKDTFHHIGGDISVVASVYKPFAEYRQDDPLVADEVAKGNVVWKPKDEWDKLTGRKPT